MALIANWSENYDTTGQNGWFSITSTYLTVFRRVSASANAPPATKLSAREESATELQMVTSLVALAPQIERQAVRTFAIRAQQPSNPRGSFVALQDSRHEGAPCVANARDYALIVLPALRLHESP